MKRKASVIGLLLALLMILGACGGANDKPDVGAAETLQPTAEPAHASQRPGRRFLPMHSISPFWISTCRMAMVMRSASRSSKLRPQPPSSFSPFMKRK